MTILSEIERINSNIDQSYNVAASLGAEIPTVKNSVNLPSTIQSIPTGGPPESTIPFGVNPSWVDVEKVMAADTNGYTLKYGMVILNDEVKTTATFGTDVALITTSDGGHIVGNKLNSYTWDTTADVQAVLNGMPVYKTRWIICHISNTVSPTTAITVSTRDNMLYLVLDGLQFGEYVGYNKLRLKTFKLLNGANVHSSITNFGDMFNAANDFVGYDPSLDFRNANSMLRTFYNNSQLEAVSLVGTGVADFTQCFYGCANIKSIQIDDMSSCTNTASMFSGCVDITNLLLKNLKVSTTIASGTTYGSLLSQLSLHYIIDNLATVEIRQTLTMGTANLAKVDATHKVTAEAKNWALA